MEEMVRNTAKGVKVEVESYVTERAEKLKDDVMKVIEAPLTPSTDASAPDFTNFEAPPLSVLLAGLFAPSMLTSLAASNKIQLLIFTPLLAVMWYAFAVDY